MGTRGLWHSGGHHGGVCQVERIRLVIYNKRNRAYVVTPHQRMVVNFYTIPNQIGSTERGALEGSAADDHECVVLDGLHDTAAVLHAFRLQ